MRRLATTAITLLLLVASALAACGGEEGDDNAATQTDSPSTDEVWSLERIRSEGSPGDVIAEGSPGDEKKTATESGITTRAYVVCDGPRSVCKSDPPLRVPFQHAALEVTRDGRSALFGLGAEGRYWVAGFDADSVFVMDDPQPERPTRGTGIQQMRHRLLGADGTEVQLQLLDDPAPAIPGPGVFVIDHSWYQGDDVEAVYLVDEREGTLRPLDVPHRPTARWVRSVYWGPNVDEFLWYVDRDCRVVWAIDGTFEQSRPDCAHGRYTPTYMHDDWFPDEWLQPGRMALLEESYGRLFLNVTLDYANTWQRIPVSDEDAIPGALQRLG